MISYHIVHVHHLMVGNTCKCMNQLLSRGVVAWMLVINVLAIDVDIHIFNALLLLLTFINLSNSYNTAQVCM